MPKSRFSALFSALLLFCSGVLVGGVSYRLYMVKTVVSSPPGARPQRPSPEDVRKHLINEMQQKIKVDDQQISKINAIMDQTQDDFKQIRDKLNSEGKTIHDRQWSEIRALLRPDQMPTFDQWRAEREAEHRKRMEKKQ